MLKYHLLFKLNRDSTTNLCSDIQNNIFLSGYSLCVVGTKNCCGRSPETVETNSYISDIFFFFSFNANLNSVELFLLAASDSLLSDHRWYSHLRVKMLLCHIAVVILYNSSYRTLPSELKQKYFLYDISNVQTSSYLISLFVCLNTWGKTQWGSYSGIKTTVFLVWIRT